MCWSSFQNYEYSCIWLSSFSTSRSALHRHTFVLLWTHRLRHREEETGWGRREEKAAFLGLCCYTMILGIYMMTYMEFRSGTPFLCPQRCPWEHSKMPWFPQGAYNSNRLGGREESNQGNRNQNWNNLPKVKQQLGGRAPDEAKTSDSSPVPCPAASFFPQEAVFPLAFAVGRGVTGVTLWFPFWSFSKRHLDNCSVQASLNYKSAEITENAVNVPVHL